MKIGIHNRPGSFSDYWIAYCDTHNIPYKLVDAYSNDIIKQLDDCDIFMWHHRHDDYRDLLFAKQLLYSLQIAGKTVFPDFSTGWHFDDKVGQKYLLESVQAPLIPSYAFYEKETALSWAQSTNYPKVFKLRGGAGGSNVQLVKNKSEARKLIRRAFGRGFGKKKFSLFVDEWRKYRLGHSSKKTLMLRFGNIFIPTLSQRMTSREKGYLYFQDFIPNNDCEYRVVVIGDRILAEKRYCRENDFRASGSSNFEYSEVSKDILRIAFDVAEKLRLQAVAFDFVIDDGKPLIVEMSYCFGFKGLKNCPGYYSRDLEWHEASHPDFCGWMVENIIKQFNENKSSK